MRWMRERALEVASLLISVAGVLVAILAALSTARIARVGLAAVSRTRRWIVYLWPALAVVPIAVFIFVWSPTTASFPASEFYVTAAEVIPLLTIALMVERMLISALPRVIYVEFIAMLLIGELAAFLALSRIVAGETDRAVGGGYALTGILATFTAAGLIAGGLLVVAAALRRDEASSN